jgi:hypothetical protein
MSFLRFVFSFDSCQQKKKNERIGRFDIEGDRQRERERERERELDVPLFRGGEEVLGTGERARRKRREREERVEEGGKKKNSPPLSLSTFLSLFLFLNARVPAFLLESNAPQVTMGAYKVRSRRS